MPKEIKIVKSTNNIEYQLHAVSIGRGDKRVKLGFVPVRHDLISVLNIPEPTNCTEFASAKRIEAALQAQLAIEAQAMVRNQC